MGGTSDSVKMLVLDEAIKSYKSSEKVKIIFVFVNGLAVLCCYSWTWPLEDFDHTDLERVLRNQLRDYSSRIACTRILLNSARIIVNDSSNHFEDPNQCFWMLFVSIKPNKQFRVDYFSC